jgi:RNA polymerase primary sigma factor
MNIHTKERQIFVNRNNLNKMFTSEMSRFNVISADEEQELIKLYKTTGDLKYRDKLINSHQRFLYSAAKNYSNDPDIMLELINEANYGLIVALDSYDQSKGFRFLSYAQAYVRKYMTEYITRKGTLVKNEFIRRCGYKIKKEREKFFVANHRYPEHDELTQIMLDEYNIDITKYIDYIDQSYIRISSHVSKGDDCSDTYEDVGVFAETTASYNDYEDIIDDEYNKYVVEKMLSTLKDKERDMVKMLYGIGYNEAYRKEDIAKKYNVTIMRVEQIVNGAIQRLQKTKDVA